MKIVIDLELTPVQKKIVRLAVVSGVVIAALGIGLAVAAPHQWTSGDPLKATDLNGLNVVTFTSDAGTTTYSVGATKFCGVGPATTTGAASYKGATGAAAMKKMCQDSVGCGSSATAHLCTSEELARSSAAPNTISFTSTTAWYTTGTYVIADPSTSLFLQDCEGWTYAGSDRAGASWNNPTTVGSAGQSVPNGFPGGAACSDALQVLCCD